MCACMHIHVCMPVMYYTFSSVCEPVLCRYMCKWNPEVNIWYLPSLLSTLLLGTNLPLNLNLTNSARLDGQQAAGVLSPTAPGLQRCTDRPTLLCRGWGSELTPSGLSSQQFIRPFLQPLFLKGWNIKQQSQLSFCLYDSAWRVNKLILHPACLEQAFSLFFSTRMSTEKYQTEDFVI